MGNEYSDCDGYCWCAGTNIRKGMDQNLGKILGASNINELLKIKDHPPRNGAHTEKVSVHQIKNFSGTSGPRNGPGSRKHLP